MRVCTGTRSHWESIIYPIIAKKCWKIWCLQCVNEMNKLGAIHRIWCGESTSENKPLQWWDGKYFNQVCNRSVWRKLTLETDKVGGIEWWFRFWPIWPIVKGTIDLSHNSNDVWFCQHALAVSFFHLVISPSSQHNALALCDSLMSPVRTGDGFYFWTNLLNKMHLTRLFFLIYQLHRQRKFSQFLDFSFITFVCNFQIVHGKWPECYQKLWTNVFPHFYRMNQANRFYNWLNYCRRCF